MEAADALAKAPASLTTAAAKMRYLVSGLLSRTDATFVSPLFKGEKGHPFYPTNQILVGFKKGLPQSDQQKYVRGLKSANMRQLFGRPHWVLSTVERDGFAVLALANRIALEDNIRYAEPDFVMTGSSGSVPHPESWPLDSVGQSLPFPYILGFDLGAAQSFQVSEGYGIRALILDSGIEMSHPALGQVNGGLDFTATASSPRAYPQEVYENHGTAVAGCFAGVVDGYAIGSAPGATATAARIGNSYSSNGRFGMATSWFTDALAWGTWFHFCRISVNSNYFDVPSSAIDAVYEDTADTTLHFVAAGNDSAPSISYPANLPSVYAVGSVEPDGSHTSFSNTGSELAFVAPGKYCFTTDRTGSDGYTYGDYERLSGTSFANPYAAGVAAVIWTRYPSYTPAQVIEHMKAIAIDLGAPGKDNEFGWGMVQLP